MKKLASRMCWLATNERNAGTRDIPLAVGSVGAGNPLSASSSHHVDNTAWQMLMLPRYIAQQISPAADLTEPLLECLRIFIDPDIHIWLV